jgi:hypothetical protein
LKIQVNSDKNIQVDKRVISWVRDRAERTLKPYQRNLTRVEFHLSDVNSHKFGTHDKRCLVEARPAHRKPLAVTAAAANVRGAVQGALSKVRSALEKYFGRSIRTTKARRPRAVAARAAVKKSAVKKSAAPQTMETGRGPKKKPIYQARRKSWPMRRASTTAA